MKPDIPKGWRQGQTIFNFLEWLRTKKGYQASDRMADIFHVSDEELDELYNEFINTHGTK